MKKSAAVAVTIERCLDEAVDSLEDARGALKIASRDISKDNGENERVEQAIGALDLVISAMLQERARWDGYAQARNQRW